MPKEAAHSLVVAQGGRHTGHLMPCENFSSLHRLLWVTALVSKFVHLLHLKVRKSSESAPTDHLSEIDQARLYWLRDAQSQLQDSKFPLWKHQFNQYEFQMWRCGARMSNSDLPLSAQTLIRLDKNRPLTALILMDAHQCVMHNGVKETITELWSSYWLVWGRQFVHKVIHHCLTCRKLEERSIQSVSSQPLPEYCVSTILLHRSGLRRSNVCWKMWFWR